MKKLLLLIAIMIFGELSAQDFDRVFVFLNVNPNKEAISEDSVNLLMELHFENMANLGTQGKLINAGPFEGGGGLFVMNSPSVDTVTQWLQTDPAVKANRWLIEMYPFTTTEGGSCVVGVEYEMVMYQFVRYAPSNEIANYKTNASAENANAFNGLLSQLKQKETLIMAGHFGSGDGGILVLKSKEGIDLVKSSEAYSVGNKAFEFKELWIAKGSFCE